MLNEREGDFVGTVARQLACCNGAPRVAFVLVSQTAHEVVFANPAHDYPQRVRYWREGDLLKAEIALADGLRAMAFTYRRAGAAK